MRSSSAKYRRPKQVVIRVRSPSPTCALQKRPAKRPRRLRPLLCKARQSLSRAELEWRLAVQDRGPALFARKGMLRGLKSDQAPTKTRRAWVPKFWMFATGSRNVVVRD